MKPQLTACVALLRGVNVGRAKRIAMADLRDLVEGLGFSGVRTLLNSGNVVFHAARPDAKAMAASIESAILARCGFPSAVVVITASELDAIVAENPLARVADDPSRYLVAFTARSATLAGARTLLAQSWAPDALAVGRRAAYLWCPHGISESKLMPAFSRVSSDGATTRNWSTVLKLQDAATRSG